MPRIFKGISTVKEADDLIRELEQAQNSHRSWLKRFLRTMICRAQPEDIDFALDGARKCSFGQWCENDAPSGLLRHPGFSAIVAAHDAVHKNARELALRIKSGDLIGPEEYDLFANSSDYFKLRVRGLVVECRDIVRNIDSLTGITNRMGMFPWLEDELARINRGGPDCAVIMFDLDHFKLVNDSYGHAAGDKVLKAVAEYFLDHLRPYDEIFRYGGEEFLLCFPNTAKEAALLICERLRKELAQLKINIADDKELSITASFGLAMLESKAELAVAAADQAMYKAKKMGRNQVCSL